MYQPGGSPLTGGYAHLDIDVLLASFHTSQAQAGVIFFALICYPLKQ